MKDTSSYCIRTEGITVTYDRKPALWDIDLQLPAGRTIGIIGPNGSGKTTLLNTIMGLIEPDDGTVRIFDEPLRKVRERISYVPQRGSVDWDFPATVKDIVRMGRYRRSNILKKLTGEDEKNVERALKEVDIKPLANRHISQLSGGQQQRVFIARALAQRADLYLMDEPFAGVDMATENAIIELLNRMKTEGKTAIIVHHDLQTAAEHFDHIVLLNTRLIASGPKEEVLTPELLQEAYGGRLTVLSRIGELMKEKDLPIREAPNDR